MPVLPLVGSTRVAPRFRTPRPPAAPTLRPPDHREADAVLDAAAGIAAFHLGTEARDRTRGARNAAELNQWGSPHGGGPARADSPKWSSPGQRPSPPSN